MCSQGEHFCQPSLHYSLCIQTCLVWLSLFSGSFQKYCKLKSQFPTANSSISERTEVTSWYTYFSSDAVLWSLILRRARAIIFVAEVYVTCIEKWPYATYKTSVKWLILLRETTGVYRENYMKHKCTVLQKA